ncbi:MAG TPA: transcriptional repressor [Treponemataceae bacterium]|nr:transcriptional repressor [Treponemataceae bacterium]
MTTDKQTTTARAAPSTARRNTAQRTAILELLKSTKTHPTAAWLHERLREAYPGISLGTVYRNLALLVDEGRAISLPTAGGIDRFDADTGEHYHVECERCGRVDDVPAPRRTGDAAIRDDRAARATGYRVTGHRLFYFGICPACLARERKKNNS